MKKILIILSALILSFTVVFFVSDINAQDKVYKIGDKGPAGGWIFYDKGDNIDGWRYLEAAPVDQSTYANWGVRMRIGVYDKKIGSGKCNTEKIISTQGRGKQQKYAAELCSDYRGGGQSDWFLPSLAELELIYKNLYKNRIGNLGYYNYWSSSEHDDNFACYLYFGDGKKMANYKYQYPCRVRAIRAF